MISGTKRDSDAADGKWRWPLLVAGITVVGLAIRLAMAWAMRYPAFNGDFSIIGLMARHMAEGTDYPVFAYGVAYMGSLEPALAALMARVVHVEVSAFIVNLSPALVGTLLLPLLYLFGRDAGSRRAGVMAMLFCLVGSDTLLHNSVAPRGGYMNVMVGGFLALWLACRIATRESRGESVPRTTYLMMGLAAGLAWWVTQLVVVFLMAAIVVLLAGFRWRMIRVGLLPAIVGVVMGALPWFGWNLTHEWASMDFGDSLSRVSFAQGISSFGQMFLKLFEFDPLISWRGAPRLMVLLGLIGCFLVLLIRGRLGRERDERFFFRLGALLLFVFMMLIYSRSAFSRVNTTRYLLPLFPAVAVMVAVAADWCLTQFRLPWGWLVFILVIPPHILLLPKMFNGVPADQKRWALAKQLQREVAPLCDGNFVGDLYTTHWLNFASRESLCVTSLPFERYAPYAKRVELAGHRAYLNGYGNLCSFLSGTKGGSHQITCGELLVDYDLVPPSDQWHYLERHDIASIRDQQGQDWTADLTDIKMDTTWGTHIGQQAQRILTVVFARPVSLCGLRLFSPDNCYPGRISMESRTDSNDVWSPLLSRVEMTANFWSGSYVMIDGVQYFQELRCNWPTNGVREIRMVFHGPDNTEEYLELGGILFMEADANAKGVTGEGWSAVEKPERTVARCRQALEKEGLTRVYAPRWLSEQLWMASSNVTTLLPSLLSRSIHEMAKSDSRDPYPLVFSGKTGLFMDNRDVPRSREVLRDAEMSWHEIALGRLTLLVVLPDTQKHAGSPYSRVLWAEQGCFGTVFSKERSQLLYESAMGLMPSNRQAAIAALRQAVVLYPSHYLARQSLVSMLREAGAAAEADSHAAIVKASTQPAVPGVGRFRNGVELLGVSVGGVSGGTECLVTRGQELAIQYFWKCPEKLETERCAVFVHIKQKKALFQDDHVFLSEIPVASLKYQPFPEIYIENRKIMVPASVEPGDYQVWIGLLDRRNGKRVSVQTALPDKRNAVQMPVTIRIRRGEDVTINGH